MSGGGRQDGRSTGVGSGRVPVLERLRTAVRTSGRVSAGPLLVRAVVFGAGFATLLLALPSPLWSGRFAAAVLLLAAMPAIYPGSGWVSALEFLAVVVWFGTTTLFRYEIPPAQLLGLATAVYLHHSWSARAGVLPVDAVVPARLLRDWLVRTAGVLVVALPLGLLALGLPELLGRSRAVYLPVFGVAAVLAAGYGLVRLARATR